MDEEEEKFGLVPDDADSDDSGEVSEGECEISYYAYLIPKDTDAHPPSRPTKKHDEESISSGKRDDSPILKKASVSLRSTFHSLNFHRHTALMVFFM